MRLRGLESAEAPSTAGRYAQALEGTGATRTLCVSGQIPVTTDGSVPTAFEEQARLVFANIAHQLAAADMSLDNVAKLTAFLSDRRYAAEFRAVRQAILGERRPALTVIICDIFDEAWLLEVEAIAVA